MEITKQKYLKEFREKNPFLSWYSDEEILAKAKEKRPDLKFVEEKWYLEEVGTKVLEWVDNALTDVADLTVWNAVRGLGWEYEAKPLRHLLWIKDESNYKWGLIKNMSNSIGKAGELVSQSIDSIADDHSLPNIWKELFNIWWNIVWWVTNTLIWETLASWFDTLVQDETQENIKQYLAEESQKNSITWNVLKWLEKLNSEMERIRVEDPDRYRTLQASFGWLDAVPISKWKQVISSIWDFSKKYWKKWIEALKNKVDDGLKIIDNLKNKSDDVVENIWENIDNIKPKESFFTKMEEKIAWIDEQTKNILKNTSEEDFDNYLNYAKNAVEDIKNPTPLEIAWDEAGDVLKTLWNMKNNAWKLKSEALKNVENIEIDTKPIFDDFVDFLEKSNLTIDWEWKIKNIAWKVASVWDDSIKDIQNLSDEMMEIFTREKVDLWSLDSLVDRIQDWINFKALNRPGATPSKTEKQISWFLGKSLNDKLKSEAWEDFVKYNEEFRKILNLETKLSRLLWEDWNKGGSLMKAVFSPTDRWVKKLFSDIQKETWVDLISKAWLAKFAMQAVWDARQASLLEALDLWPWFTWKLKNNLSKIPIVWNVLDLAEDWAKKVFTPEKVWKKIVYKARTNLDEAKHYTNVDSSIYKNISEIEVENTIKKYFWDEVWVEFLEKIKTPEWLDALWRYKDKFISFAKNPKENVVEHEALHAYFDLALKESEKTNILNKIKNEKNFKDLLDAEEFLADSFADFVIWRRNVSWISENLKKIIWDLAFKFKQFFGKEDKIEALFRDLESIWNWKKKFEIKADWNSGEKKFLLAWEKAENSPKSILEKAKDMEAEWKTSDEIWEATWWEKWKDWKWRFEIDDSKAGFIWIPEKKTFILKDVLNHKELFENYPQLKNTRIVTIGASTFWWYTEEGIIFLNSPSFINKTINGEVKMFLTPEWKKTLLHELQHLIQDNEGFAIWTAAYSDIVNTFFEKFWWEKSRFDIYKSFAWETEARNVSSRYDINSVSKKKTRPSLTEDVWRDNQIVHFDEKKELTLKEIEEAFEFWDDEYRLLWYGSLPLEKSGMSLAHYIKTEAYYNKYKKLLEKAKKWEKIDLNSGEKKFLLAWEKAENSPKSILEKAKDMEAEWKTPDEIWKATWWEKWKDWKWRFEIDDSKSELKIFSLKSEWWKSEYSELFEIFPVFKELKKSQGKDAFKLWELIEHSELFKNYPELKNLEINFKKLNKEWWFYSPENNSITLNSELLKKLDDWFILSKNWKSILMHELQHKIQEIEWFSNWSNSNSESVKKYLLKNKNSLIEKVKEKIKEVEWRMNKTDEEIMKRMLYEDKSSVKKYRESRVKEIEKLKWEIERLEKWDFTESEKYDAYEKIAWETEARNVEKRMNMLETARQRKRPEKTEDISREDQWLNDNKENNWSVENDFKVKTIRNNFIEFSKKEGININTIEWSNEWANLLKTLAEFNKQIPKWYWNKTPRIERLYQKKYEIAEYLINWLKKWNFKWDFKWWTEYVNKIKYATLRINIWKHSARFHIDLNADFIPNYLKK